MDSNIWNQVIEETAKRGLKNQVQKPGDYRDEKGLLVCGVCGVRKQEYIPLGEKMLLVPCTCKCDEEAEQKRREREKANEDLDRIQRLKSLNIADERTLSASFDGFEKNAYNGKALKLCRRYVEKFETLLEKNQGLLFWGDTGTGKSFAAACIANELLKSGVPVTMTSFVKIIDEIQRGTETIETITRWMSLAKLVVFDDLGAERKTDYALELIYGIVDSRYRQKKPMIFTTNLSTKDMMDETDIRYRRIYERIFSCCLPIQFSGPSWRMKEAARRFEEVEKLLEE